MTKKLLLAGISIVGLVIAVYIFTAQYPINEITPDNYQTKLKKGNGSLFSAGLDDAIPDRFSLISAYKYSNSDNFRNNGLKVINKETKIGNHVEIYSASTGLNYWLTFDGDNLTSVYIFKKGLLDPNSPSNPHVKDIINKLILNNGFVLKRTELKIGQ